MQADAEKIFAAAVAAIGARSRALVLEEARKCSLPRLRNLVRKQDPSGVAWYVFGRTKLQNWLADNATMSVFGLKTHGKLQKVATPITSTGDWSPAPLPGGWIINPEVDRRTQSKVMPDISQLKIKVSSQEAPGLGHFSWIGQFQRRDDLDFWYWVPPKQRKKRAQRLNPADAAPSSVVVSSSAPIADDTAVTAIHGDASWRSGMSSERVALLQTDSNSAYSFVAVPPHAYFTAQGLAWLHARWGNR